MGFWNKLGKIALQAAPYVAAPFTGGASLMATGVTQKLGQKWAEHDAKEAIAKGIAPSKFDKYLGMASAGAGLASAFTGGFGGALNGAGKTVGTGVGAGAKVGSIASKAGTGASSATKLGGFSGQLANAMSGKGAAGAVMNATGVGGGSDWKSQLGGLIANAAATRGDDQAPDVARTGLAPSSSVPAEATAVKRSNSVADALNMGRQQAVNNQPFRAGYQTQVKDEDDNIITHDMPPIYSDLRSQVVSPPISESTPLANRFGDNLTPRRNARKRYPQQEVVEE